MRMKELSGDMFVITDQRDYEHRKARLSDPKYVTAICDPQSEMNRIELWELQHK